MFFNEHTLPEFSVPVLITIIILGASLAAVPFVFFGIQWAIIRVGYWGSLWFSKDWYKYLFASKSQDYSWREVIWCRAKGHPAGVVWHCLECSEPDMTCKGCGDDLS